MTGEMNLVFIGLSLGSSWGNGHATTYRALLRGLARAGHRVTFLERDVPWYAHHRDLATPDYCQLEYYRELEELDTDYGDIIASADAVIIGSYVPDGVAVADKVLARAGGLVAFYDIDTPITLAKLEQGDTEYLASRLVPAFDLYLSFAGGPTLDRLRAQFGARLAKPLYCMVDADLYAPTGEERVWDLGYLGTYSPDRQEALDSLLLEPARRLPDHRFVVAGPQYPADIAWPVNVDRIDHVPPREHPSFYSRLRFTLNVTRADMRAAGWSPSVRLFEAAACETAILSDHWEGLDAFFPIDEAILTVAQAEDVVGVLRDIDERRIAELTRRARETTLARHTGDVRAAELLEALSEAARGKRPREFSMSPAIPSDEPPSDRARRNGKGKGNGKGNGHSAIAALDRYRNGSNTSSRRRRPARPAAVVAGGAGFLGSHLCDRLIGEGRRVYCVDSYCSGLSENVDHLAGEPDFVLMEHDVRDALPTMLGVQEIYNLACPASPAHYQKDPVHTLTTSVVGTLNLLELAACTGARFIMASTSEVYGDPEVHPQPENYRGSVNPLGPRACYDEGKRAAEALCFDFLRAARADVRVARIFNTYGPRMRANDGRIVSNFIVQALSGGPLTIYGSGEQTRSFCYVDDLIEAMMRLARLDEAPATPVNLGNPGEFSVRELAELVCRLTGCNGPIVHEALPEDDPRRRRPDIGLARELLGWQPTVSLEEGLVPTIEWFSSSKPGLQTLVPARRLRVSTSSAAAGKHQAI